MGITALLTSLHSMTRGISTTGLSAAHILLVDDNCLGLAARKVVLEELGHRITTAPGGQEALEAFARGHFDLVITDYKMPKMNGIEFIRKIREKTPALPVILISGYADTLGLDETNSGADVVIQKNANEVSHLVRSVNRLLRRKPARKPAGAEQVADKVRRKGT